MTTERKARERVFEPFFREHVADVRRYSASLVVADEVDDVVSATFVTAWQRFGNIPSESPRVWLFGVVRNHCRNSWRSRRRTKSVVDTIVHERPAIEARLSDTGLSWTEIGPLLQALRELGDEDRELMVLAGWFELTPSEIAAVLEKRPGTVRTRLHRVRKVLGARFQELVEGGEMV